MQYQERKRMNAIEWINDGASTSAAGAVEITQVDEEIASILTPDCVGIDYVRKSFMKTHWQIEAHEIHRDKELDVRPSLAIDLSTILVTVRFGSVRTQFRGTTPYVWSGASRRSSFSTNLTRGLATRRLFRVPHAENATYIYEHLCLLRDSNPDPRARNCQVIYSQFGLAIHQTDHQARRRFVEWAQNEIAVVPDFHKRILFSDETHFWLNGYVNKQNYHIWSEANPQVYVETTLHPEN
ncbi:hypothetical protein TNCV_4424201 [Trichonephila clavipes]|nr:hypothetical protein TNCV_4424201 [Trichonephila clavipes]